MLRNTCLLILMATFAYLWGSIPAGYWMGKLLRGKDFDIRQYGSKKIGATNVLHTLGKVPALIVSFIDISKGVGPVLLATYVPLLNTNGWGPTVVGIMALLGHCCPVFIGFRGGRGVATAVGGTLVLSPVSFLISTTVAFSTAHISRYISLGTIAGCITLILCGIVFYIAGYINPAFFAHVSLAQLVFLTLVPLFVILFHQDNIGRLLAGTESKMRRRRRL
jgi:acyl phosphate:glycerol-3-phosphate acyltransferase